LGSSGGDYRSVLQGRQSYSAVYFRVRGRFPFAAPAACRHFLNWFDETDRAAVRHELLAEVVLASADRGQTAQAAA
jgi:hypothetical protein